VPRKSSEIRCSQPLAFSGPSCFPTASLAAALPVLYREQTGHPRKERRLNLLLRLRHGPLPCEPDDVSQAVLDLATRDWWYCAPDDEIEMATNIHDGTNPSVLKQ
jgi:hypothetical protein